MDETAQRLEVDAYRLTRADQSLVEDAKGLLGGHNTPDTLTEGTPERGLLTILDDSFDTKRQVWDLEKIPNTFYTGVTEYMAAKGGGITIGNKSVLEQPGGEHLSADPPPSGVDNWADVAGIYLSDARRILVNSGALTMNSTVLHEVGHTVVDAYRIGVRAEEFSRWSAARKVVLAEVQNRRGWIRYYSRSAELWPEGFAAWLKGDAALDFFTCYSKEAAKALKEYYDWLSIWLFH
jgi:hypothetical protein